MKRIGIDPKSIKDVREFKNLSKVFDAIISADTISIFIPPYISFPLKALHM